MNIFFKCKKVELNTKLFGKIQVDIDRRNKIGNGYFVETYVDDKYVSGYVDLNYNEVIELDERFFEEEFHTKGYKDICLKFFIEGEDYLECYHINNDEKSPKVVHVVGPYSDNKYEIIDTEDRDYWLFKRYDEEDEEYAVYDINKRKQITSYFDYIEFVDESEKLYHTIFFQKNIKSSTFDEETGYIDHIIHTTIYGYLDSEGNFSSAILDRDEEKFYSTSKMGDNTFSPLFDKFISALQANYLEKCFEKECRIGEYVDYLALNPNMLDKKNKQKAKIINFNDRRNV